MIDKITTLMKVERVDDIPVLMAHMQTMQVATLLDQFFATHGNWEGELSFGQVTTTWLGFILSEGDHRLSQAEPWAEQHVDTLSACWGRTVRALDFSDDRLANILDRLSDAAAWNGFEGALTGGLLRVYELAAQRIRLDSTSAKTYAGVSPDGLFQFGHSKDHRPDLAQVKISLSVLDPLGLPLTTTVVGGNCADDPLYVPEIRRVQKVLGAGGKTYIGDCKMGSLATRAYLAASQDYYLCPLGGVQMPEQELDALLEPLRRGQQKLQGVYQKKDQGTRSLIAQGYEVSVPLTAQVDGQSVTWGERRLTVRSLAQARQQAQQLDKRLQRAHYQIQRLNIRKQGKRRLDAEALQAAAVEILQQLGVAGLIRITVKTRTRERSKRKYGTRPEQVIEQSQSRVGARLDRVAVAAAKQRMGWRVYATNHPRLTLSQTVQAYRGQYRIERGFGRLKGRALSLVPLFLHTDERVVGLIRLLSLALRVLTLVEVLVRRQLAKEGTAVVGLYAGNKKRETTRPTAERLLRAFEGISLVVVRRGGQVQAMLSALSPLQEHLLQLLGQSVQVYERLVHHFSKPPLNLGET
jgi:transposase